MSVRLPFHSSLCLFTRLSPLLFLFSLSPTVAEFPRVPCRTTPEAVVDNPGRDRSSMDLSTFHICIIWKKSFTPDALPAATLPIYPGFEPA